MCDKENKNESCDCEQCENKCSDTKVMPNGEKIATFKEQPTIIDVAKMMAEDEGFKKATEGTEIVATRILKHSNGQGAVVQIYFHKRSAIQIVQNLPKA